jgi:hypothetical protein
MSDESIWEELDARTARACRWGRRGFLVKVEPLDGVGAPALVFVPADDDVEPGQQIGFNAGKARKEE